MSKIAIVGVDGSGKTVMMAALGEKYEGPDENGFFLSAVNPATFNVVKMLIDQMRHSRWPAATERDIVTSLDWKLFRRVDKVRELVCDFTFLDYAGEIYRLAFGDHDEEERANFSDQIEALRKHIQTADALIVLVNLKDIISGDLSKAKTRETLWLTKDILDFAIGNAKVGKVALVFFQSAVYKQVLEASGGLEASYQKFLPHVESMYPGMKLFAVSAIDRTLVDDSGFEVPAPDFRSDGLEELMEWIISCVPGYETFFSDLRERPKQLWAEVERCISVVRNVHDNGWKALPQRLAAAKHLKDAVAKFFALPAESRKYAIGVRQQNDALKLASDNLDFETELLHLIDSVTATNEDDVVSHFHALWAALELWRNDEECYLSEINQRISEVKVRHAFVVKCAKIAAGIVICCAICGAGAFATIKYVENRRIERAAREARSRMLKEKRQMGYTISGDDYKWIAGVVVPKNTNLVTGLAEGDYMSKRPGYGCVRWSLIEEWRSGLPHADCPGLVSGETEGTWVSKVPGYQWTSGTNVAWKSGLANPRNTSLVSEEREGQWRSTKDGYIWAGDDDIEWRAGIRHAFDERLVSLAEEGKWTSTCPGYAWDGASNAVWTVGLPHPENKSLKSADIEGHWQTDRPGYLWDFSRKCEVWTANLSHPSEHGLKSSEREGTWVSVKPGYVWDGGAGLKWKSGLRHPKEPSLVSGDSDQWISEQPGYAWDGKDGIVWTKGKIHPKNKNLAAAENEGMWESVRAGYKWVAGTNTDAWEQGVSHPRNAKLKSDKVEGRWVTDEPGYIWNKEDGVEWKAGLVHPLNASLVSEPREGAWRCIKAGYAWSSGSQIKWMPGTPHPQNEFLKADDVEGKWKSTRPGFSWTGYGTSESWASGLEHPVYPHWVSQTKEGTWAPAAGYKKKHFWSGEFSELEYERRPTGKYVTENPILGSLRGISAVLASPFDILWGAFSLTGDAANELSKPGQTEEEKQGAGLAFMIVMPITLSAGAVGGTFFCLGDVSMGCVDMLTFGMAGDYYFYNDSKWGLKPWCFKRKSPWSFK